MEKHEDYSHYAPAHSDFLIHWTGGHDIDEKHDNEWFREHTSQTDSTVTRLYLERLKSILKHGLWMTDDNETINIMGQPYPRPPHCRICFSELKLSTVRGHARRYGRLGIGFKRFFLFDRLGSPMVYYQAARRNWLIREMWENAMDQSNDYFRCFLKPMNETASDTTMKYSFFDESEWRIIYSDEIEKRLDKRGMKSVLDKFIPEERFSAETLSLAAQSSNPPRALIPIRDIWFAMIIYPSIAAKVEAEADQEIRTLINGIKPFVTVSEEYPKSNPAIWENSNKPIELDLDSCRNF